MLLHNLYYPLYIQANVRENRRAIKNVLKVILHQFWVKKIFPWKFNLEYDGTFTKLFMHVSSGNMFPTTRNLQIVCMFIVFAIIVETDWLSVVLHRWLPIITSWRKVWSDDCRSWPREEKINNHGCWGKHAHIPDNDYWGICREPICYLQLFLCGTHGIYIYIYLHQLNIVHDR